MREEKKYVYDFFSVYGISLFFDVVVVKYFTYHEYVESDCLLAPNLS